LKGGPHKQVWTKVNAFVDEGVVDLIAALSSFPQLRTVESCEDVGDGGSWVCFQYNDENLEQPWHSLAEFVLGFFGPGLMRQIGDGVQISIFVRTNGLPQAELAIRPEVRSATAKAIRRLSRDYRGRP